MDRPFTKGKRISKWYVIAGGLLGIVIVIAIINNILNSPLGSIKRSDLLLGQVKFGEFSVKVLGQGELKAMDFRWITAQSNGIVSSVSIQPGAVVQKDAVIAVLENRALVREKLRTELDRQQLIAQTELVKTEIENTGLALKLAEELEESRYEEARLQLEAGKDLYEKRAISDIDFKLREIRASNADLQRQVARSKIENHREYERSTLKVRQSLLDNNELQLKNIQDQIDGLEIRAPIDGVVQELRLEHGQDIGEGAVVCLVVGTGSLQPQVRVPENRANELSVGQPAVVSIQDESLTARVARIDPSVVGGNVVVDLHMVDEIPSGSRRDQSVTAEITTRHISETMYAERPWGVSEHSQNSIWIFSDQAGVIEKRTVSIGTGTLVHVEIVSGLDVGDTIVRNNMNRFGDTERLQVQ